MWGGHFPFTYNCCNSYVLKRRLTENKETFLEQQVRFWSLNEDVNRHYWPPPWASWRDKQEKGWPGARCSLWWYIPSPWRLGSGGERGRGYRGGTRALSSGAARLWHESPACWDAALETLEERSRAQWPSNATPTRLSVCSARHNSYSVFSTHTHAAVHLWRGWIRSASLVKQVGYIHSRTLNTNYSH